MLVDALRGETAGYVSFYASLFSEEPLTLRAFRSLLGARRFFWVDPTDTLEAMLAESGAYQAEVTRPANLGDMLLILALGLGGTVVITWLAGFLPNIGTMVSGFTWIVCLATGLGVVLSFTPLRRLEGSGASVVGTVFLYMLIVSIGAGARFASATDPRR